MTDRARVTRPHRISTRGESPGAPADAHQHGAQACRWSRSSSQSGPLGVGYAPGSTCGRPARRDGLCVFHAPKLSDDAKAALPANERAEHEQVDADFHRELEGLIAAFEESGDGDALLLTGFQFPAWTLSRSAFRTPVSFDEARFVGPVKLSRVKFLERTSFVDAHFCRDADFFQTEFHDAIFNPARFDGHVVFAEAGHGSLNFSNATFAEGAGFVESHIRSALFGGTVFSGESSFWHVTFAESGDFQFAKFLADVVFREVLFEEVCDFATTVFKGTAEFDRVTFRGVAEFGGSTVEGRLEFSPAEGSACFEAGAVFSAVRQGPKAVLSFERVDLSAASFAWTNIEPVVFNDVTWCVVARGFGPCRVSRLALADESEADAGRADFAPLSLNYRQLVRNYEAQRDYETAESFYVGEMEVRRKQSGSTSRGPMGFLRRWVNPFALYLMLSRYGSSYVQSLVVLAVLVAAVALVLLGVGFTINQDATSFALPDATTTAMVPAPGRTIQYSLWPDEQHPVLASPGAWLRDYGHALVFTSSILTLQRSRPYEPISSLGWLCVYAASVVLVGQTALVLFAVRRRFRR